MACDNVDSYTYITPASREGDGIGSKLLYARQLVINISTYTTGTMCVSLTSVFKKGGFYTLILYYEAILYFQMIDDSSQCWNTTPWPIYCFVSLYLKNKTF
jgi:hypothetical protein